MDIQKYFEPKEYQESNKYPLVRFLKLTPSEDLAKAFGRTIKASTRYIFQVKRRKYFGLFGERVWQNAHMTRDFESGWYSIPNKYKKINPLWRDEEVDWIREEQLKLMKEFKIKSEESIKQE